MARNLRENDTPRSYDALAVFARAQSKNTGGQRAALALGYRDFTRKQFKQSRTWLAQGAKDGLLEEYALYWDAAAMRSLGEDRGALKKFEEHRRRFPESVMSAQAAQAIAELSLMTDDPGRALAVLKATPDVEAKPWLLILRARARERSGATLDAVSDYLRLYYDFPLSEQAASASSRVVALRQSGNPEAFAVAPERKFARAEQLFGAKRWREARTEYDALLAELQGAARERAQLRIAQCRVALGGSPAIVAAVKPTDADVDGERLLILAQMYRPRRDEPAMLHAVEEAALRYPRSQWTEDALFLAGSYYWSQLDRPRAAAYYQRVLDGFPYGRNALLAHWRVTWNAYLLGRPGVAAQLAEHLRRFPGSNCTENALYWLGRSAEREGNPALARGYYLKLRERFPQTYFGSQAIARLRGVGESPVQPSDVLALIPPLPPPPSIAGAIPAAARDRWQRAQALRSIAFDSSAELELRAAYNDSKSPRLLLEAAKSAFDAGRYLPGVATVRQAFPQIEWRRWEEVPLEVWRAAYPVIYESEIERYSLLRDLDAALVAGIIRQESVYDRQAVSRVGAVGLMQVMPATGRSLARREKIGYTRGKLMNAEYNIRLGTVQLRDMIERLGSTEAVLAAYNAGLSRVTAWQAERSYSEPAEFVESIPFTETREYVQIVTRNTEIYRRLYGKQSASNTP